MIGILLAGGAATRLPNKPLLPQKNMEPVCFSGIDCLRRYDVSRIVVVTPPNSVLTDIISFNYEGLCNLSFVYQEEPTGVGDAINCCNEDGQERLIVAADNIYPAEELVEYNGKGLKAILRPIDAWRRPHLVTFDGLKLSRGGIGVSALTSPWFAPLDFHFSSLGWPDFEKGQLEERPAEGWWDIGTPDTYAAYWRSK